MRDVWADAASGLYARRQVVGSQLAILASCIADEVSNGRTEAFALRPESVHVRELLRYGAEWSDLLARELSLWKGSHANVEMRRSSAQSNGAGSAVTLVDEVFGMAPDDIPF